MSDLLVVILNYNTRDLLRGCLASLRAQSGLGFVICVVDNASTDGSPEIVAAEFPEVRLIRNPLNNGYSAGNNLALRGFGFDQVDATAAPTARHALLLNPDTVVPPGALAGLLAFLDTHPDVGVVGPRLLLEDGTLDAACRRGFPTPAVAFYRLTGLSRLFPNSPRFNRYNMAYLDEHTQADVDSVVGACMLLRGEAIQQVGLLDEQFFMYGEDLDWCLRIKNAGWRVVYYPDVIVHHIKRAASRGSAKARYEFQRAMWLFYRKHYQRSTPAPLDWIVKMGLTARGGRALLREMLSSAAVSADAHPP